MTHDRKQKHETLSAMYKESAKVWNKQLGNLSTKQVVEIYRQLCQCYDQEEKLLSFSKSMELLRNNELTVDGEPMWSFVMSAAAFILMTELEARRMRNE